MNNFIKITEVQFPTNGSLTPTEYTDGIHPSEIKFWELIEKNGKQYTKIHFALGNTKFDVLIKETPEELDKKITDFYKARKKKS